MLLVPSLFSLLLLAMVHEGRCQLPLGAVVPALKAGTALMNMLPAGARECVNKVTTKAVSDSLVSKIASSAGSLLGGNAPTITRDPGTFGCKDGGVPYYKETAHLKANVFNLPIDLPVTTETSLASCFKDGIPNPCTLANGLFGSNSGNLINGLTGANKPAPSASIGGLSLGGKSATSGSSSSSSGSSGGLAGLFNRGGSSSSSSSSSSGSSSSGSSGGSSSFSSLLGGSSGSSSGGVGGLLGNNKPSQVTSGNANTGSSFGGILERGH